MNSLTNKLYAILVYIFFSSLPVIPCQDYFNYRDLEYIPAFALPALVLPDRGVRFDTWKTKWLTWGYMEGVFDRQGGRRHEHKVFANNEFLVQAQIPISCDTFNARMIVSVEPGTIGKEGYPLIFSTGYTANGVSELINSYPPLDLITELSVSYVHNYSQGRWYMYFGLPGAPVVNMLVEQRIPEFFMPTGSITHKYLTSTDIVYGALNTGLKWRNFAFEASGFTGKPQDENYWKIKKPHFDSYGVRFSYCYSDAFSAQISYGKIKDNDPVVLTIVDKRLIASVAWNLFGNDYLLSNTFAYAKNWYLPGEDLNSVLFESCFIKSDRHILFGRYEYTQTDAPLNFLSREDQQNVYNVQKIGLGYRYQFCPKFHGLWSIGASGDVCIVPDNLKSTYGRAPFSLYVFLRVDLA